MLKITKTLDPIHHVEFKKKRNPKSWDDYGPDIKSSLKTHMLDKEQDGYCPYCERMINVDTSHIEHIEPKHKASNYKAYDNMLTSCNDPQTCGHAKKGTFSNDFLNPVLIEPMNFLKYKFETGEIVPSKIDESHSDYQKAQFTIDTLKLNEKDLLASRKVFNLQIANMCTYMDDEAVKMALKGYLEDKLNFKTLIEFHLQNYS
ncbi:MAG: TIGR02646 family protein [Defluviitaleaceae bacterium]|nr:TIGR02646 family protein [Defluviitaleaceae bacterium]